MTQSPMPHLDRLDLLFCVSCSPSQGQKACASDNGQAALSHMDTTILTPVCNQELEEERPICSDPLSLPDLIQNKGNNTKQRAKKAI